eukprot:2225259-Amphidinium_carterae.1
MPWGSYGWNVGTYASATQGLDGWDGTSGLRAGVPISSGGQSSDSMGSSMIQEPEKPQKKVNLDAALKIPALIDEEPIKAKEEPISGDLVNMFEEFDEDSSVEGTVETYYPDP